MFWIVDWQESFIFNKIHFEVICIYSSCNTFCQFKHYLCFVHLVLFDMVRYFCKHGWFVLFHTKLENKSFTRLVFKFYLNLPSLKSVFASRFFCTFLDSLCFLMSQFLNGIQIIIIKYKFLKSFLVFWEQFSKVLITDSAIWIKID